MSNTELDLKVARFIARKSEEFPEIFNSTTRDSLLKFISWRIANS